MKDTCKVCGKDGEGKFYYVYQGDNIHQGDTYAEGIIFSNTTFMSGGSVTDYICIFRKEGVFICQQCLDMETAAHIQSGSKVEETELGSRMALQIKEKEYPSSFGNPHWFIPSSFAHYVYLSPLSAKLQLNLTVDTPQELASEECIAKKMEEKTCFVATAAFGSPIAAEVETLRLFRDIYLRETRLGRGIILLYSTIGPYLAIPVQKYDWLRKLTQMGIRKVCKMIKAREQFWNSSSINSSVHEAHMREPRQLNPSAFEHEEGKN